MAALAGAKQILFHLQTLLRIVCTADVMNAMAIETYRHIGLLIGIRLFEKGNGCAVEVSDVGLQDLCRETVLTALGDFGVDPEVHGAARRVLAGGTLAARNGVNTV